MRGLWMVVLVVLAGIAGCNSGGGSTNTGSTSGAGTTSMAGTWTVTGTGTCSGTNCGYDAGSATATYSVILSASPCTVSTPLGSFSVSGSTCFIANNNATNGAITGTYTGVYGGKPNGPITLSKNSGVGVLVGVPSNPVPDNSTVNLVFVSTVNKTSYAEFTGTGTIAAGKLTGTGTCSTATAICAGSSVSFTATLQ